MPLTAFAIEVDAQLVALKRSAFAEAVRPAPREIVDEERLAFLEFEEAVASSPAREAKSKVNICPHPVVAKVIKAAQIARAWNLKRDFATHTFTPRNTAPV